MKDSCNHYLPRMRSASGVYVIGAGAHLYVCLFICMYVCMYVCIYVCDQKKSLNGTLAVDSPFQTLVVDFSSNLD